MGLLWELENRKKRRPTKDESLDLFRLEQPKRGPEPHAPYQLASETSKRAAKKVSPVFQGNRRACLHAIVSAASRGGTTRKQIAEAYFEGKQNYVTGPTAVLLEDHLVYEDPMRNRHGEIVTRADGSVVPRRIDGSAVLLPTAKGKAMAA